MRIKLLQWTDSEQNELDYFSIVLLISCHIREEEKLLKVSLRKEKLLNQVLNKSTLNFHCIFALELTSELQWK